MTGLTPEDVAPEALAALTIVEHIVNGATITEVGSLVADLACSFDSDHDQQGLKNAYVALAAVVTGFSSAFDDDTRDRWREGIRQSRITLGLPA